MKFKYLEFDDVTSFRLQNSFLVSISMNLLLPILTDLKGEYLAAWVISLFMIGGTLMVKTNEYFVENFSMDQMYKQGVIVHVLLVISTLVYFKDPLVMVCVDGIVAMIDIAVFSSFAIKLNNYLTAEYPEDVSKFQIVRNNYWAHGTLIGLGITTLVTFLFGVGSGLTLFVIFNTFYCCWMAYNWNFFKDIKENNEICK